MNKLIFPLAVVLIVAASYNARGDAPAVPAAANPAGTPPMVEMPLRGQEPMSIGMKKEGMMKEDVKKEPMIEEIMEKEEMKK
jgi:hypothetical protein